MLPADTDVPVNHGSVRDRRHAGWTTGVISSSFGSLCITGLQGKVEVFLKSELKGAGIKVHKDKESKLKK